jgi:hypothetical protein
MKLLFVELGYLEIALELIRLLFTSLAKNASELIGPAKEQSSKKLENL